MKTFSSKPQWTVHTDENAGAVGAAARGRLEQRRNPLGDIANTLSLGKGGLDNVTGLKGVAAGLTTTSSSSTTTTSIADLKRGLFQHQNSQPNLHLHGGALVQSPAEDALDIDAGDHHDQFACTEYTNDIDRYLRQAEGRYMVSPNYMSSQTEISEKMRAILIDWLVEVHLKFKLKHETLFLTINLLDRFLEKQAVARNKLQLVGVVALMIAAKYEEIYPPVVQDYVYICDNAYTRNQILQMEPIMLNRLGFRLTVATPHTFLRRFCKAAAGREGDIKLYNAASYVLEHALLDYSMIRHLPSMVVASAISIACKMLGRPTWSPTLSKYTRYTESTLRPVVDDLLSMMRKSGESSLKAVGKKYTSSRFDSIATLPVPAM